jgi:parallel beta-helix repeat protein
MGKTIIQRPPRSAGSVISALDCDGLRISDLTIDGNKINNSTVGYTVVLSGSWAFDIDKIEIKNTKGAGSALTVQEAVDDAKMTHSKLSNLYLHDNDGNGVYFQKHAWNWILRDSVIRNNGGDGVSVIDWVFPPVAGQFSNCEILRNNIYYNKGNGISLTSGVTGGTSLLPTNGPYRTVSNCRIVGNLVEHNSAYGIIMSGGYGIEIDSNTASYNGTGKSSEFAGINSALCEYCNVHDNVTRFNDFYGIDTGGAVRTKITNNIVTKNGNSTIRNGNGINCGACEEVDISDNLLDRNGWMEGGAQIHVVTYDGGTSGFSMAAHDIRIGHNRLICANSNQLGLLVLSDPPGMTIEENRTEGCAPFNGYVLHLTHAAVHGNRQDNWVNETAFAPSAENPVYPDGTDTIIVPADLENPTTALRPYFYSTNYQTVYSVVVHEGGSNYSSRATVRFSGGGCLLLPAGFVFNDNAGHIVGVGLTSYGSRCTHAPTVSFIDSTGSEARATASVLTMIPTNGRTLDVLWPAGITVTHDPNNFILLNAESFKVPRAAHYLSEFEGTDNHWVETARKEIPP